MTEESASTPRLRLIGHFGLFDSRGRELPISARKSRVLIAALALAPEGRLAREALATLVWGDRGEAQARGSLRQALAILRKEVAPLGPDILVSGADSVGLDIDAIDVDVCALRRAVATSDPALVARAAAFEDAPLLTDLALSHDDAEDWLAEERRRTAADMLAVLERHAAALDGTEKLRILERLVALDPLREASHRALMQAFADAGEGGLALRQYDLCKARLAKELAVDPAPETSALRAEIAGRSLATVSGRGQGDVLPSIALLPFANRSGDIETGVLCDAFTDAIVSGLARFRDLRVTAAESSFAYKGRAVPIPEAARELGVHFVLEGSVLRLGGRVRVSATLADGGNGAALWSRQFDRPDGDLSDVLDAITEQIVGQLAAGYGGSLGREWRRLSFHSGERHLRAYDHFQRGMAAYATFTRGCTDKARAEFRAALEQRPGYGKALAKISWSHATDILAGWSIDVSRDLDLSYQYAIEAIATEDGDSWGYYALAGWHWARREFDLCLSTSRTALSLNPNDADIRMDHGLFLNISGRHEEGLAEAAHAMELNPLFPEWWLMERAHMNFNARRYEDCLADLSALKIIENEFVETFRAATNAALGNSETSHRAVRRLLATAPDMTVENVSALFRAYYTLGEDGDHLVHWLRVAGLPE